MSKIISGIDLEFMCGSWRYIRFGRWGGVSEEVTSWQIVGCIDGFSDLHELDPET